MQTPEEAVIEATGGLPESLLLEDTEVPARHIGQWSMIWYRFTRHRMAVIGAWVVLAMIVLAIFGPLVSPGFVPLDPVTHNLPLWAMKRANQAPRLTWPFIMGTDGSGNVVVTYVLTGGRPLLAIGILGALLASLLGMLMGGLAGYLGSVVDAFLMRLVDALLAIPFLLFVVLLSRYITDRSVWTYILLFGLVGWPGVARLVRGYALSLREREYVTAARALGDSTWGVIGRHVLPNALDVIVVSFTLNIAVFIITEVTLEYLGAEPGSPGIVGGPVTWGTLLMAVSPLGANWWQLLFPGLALLLTVLGVNFVGDGLRDAFDATSASALASGISLRRHEPGAVRRALVGVGCAAGQARERVAGVLEPARPSRLWARLQPQRAVPASFRGWAGRERLQTYRRAPLWLGVGPIAAVFVALIVVFLYGHSPLIYSPYYAPPTPYLPIYSESAYAAWARRRGGWDIFTVSVHQQLTYIRLDRQNQVVRDTILGPGDDSTQPSMAKGHGRTLGAWLVNQAQVVQAAYLGAHHPRPISLNPAGGAAEHPYVVATPAGFDVLFDWQPPHRSAYNLYLAALPPRGRPLPRRPVLRLLVRTGDYGLYPRGIVDGSGALDVVYLQRTAPSLWHVLFQRFTPGGRSLGKARLLGVVTYTTLSPNGCTSPDVNPDQWAIDLKRAADGSVWAAWETGEDCVTRYGVSGTNELHVAHWSGTGRMLLAPAVIDPAVDAGSEAVALALQGRGGVAYYPQPGTVEPYLVATTFDGQGRAGPPQRVNYDGGGKAANPYAQSVRGRPLVIWQKVRGDGVALEGTAYHPKQPPDLLTRLGLNVGNLGGNIALVLFGSLAGGIALTVVNVFLLLPLAVVWLLVRRLPGSVRWPLYLAAIAALLAWIFARSGSLPGYVLVITALGVPYDWLAVAGGVFVSAWSGHYLLGRQESGMRATAMALIALFMVAALYTVIFIQGQITKI